MNQLNPTAEKIFKLKYSRNGEESWEECCARVANHISMGDKELLNTFFNMVYEKAFIPGGRILANSGTGIKNLMNCLVLDIEDSRQGIYKTLSEAAESFAHGYGVGYDISNIREEGAPVKTTEGKASGPLSFLSLFDQTGEVISQASRRGAQIAFLNVDHPDIEHFIHYKNILNTRNARLLEEFNKNWTSRYVATSGPSPYFYEIVNEVNRILEKTLSDDQLTHFNVSVMLNDSFMAAVLEDRDWYLISRVDSSLVKSIPAKELLYMMAQQAWESGDPGVAFYDRINEDNLVPYVGDLVSSNPCVTGDTKIHTVYEGAVSFKELADRGTDTLIYSWSPETKLPVIRIMRNPRLTRENVEVIEVEFDSGLKVKCTPDHSFYTFRGSKVEAKDLVVGQSIRAFSMSEHRDGHLRVHGWGQNNKAKHQYVARLVWECYNGKIDNPRMVLHHKDFREQNNELENLQLLTPELHNSIHYENRRRNGFHHPRNHKVVAIREAGYADVYNGTVDETHTYIIADEESIAGIASGIVSANCSELFLFPGEGCCLGSINLLSVYDEGHNTINWEFLEYLVRNAVIFLDNVQEVSQSPIEHVNKMSKDLRRLGLGVMGWADLLAEMDIAYNSDEAYKLARKLSWFISYFGTLQSMALAQEKGVFPLYDPDKVDLTYTMRLLNDPEFSPRKFEEDEVKKIGFRNVAITSLAPTGTIALLAGVNSSIEPFFALAYKRHITEGVGNTAKDTIIEINPILKKKLEKLGAYSEEIDDIFDYISETGTLKNLPENFEFQRGPFITASEIEPTDHLLMQAAWQEFTQNSISKTINMPEQSTVEEIANVILDAWNLNLKSTTIYRNNSKLFQILNAGITK